MGRRYEEVNDMDEGCFDKYDDYSARFQPARSKKHSGSGESRYEVTRPSLKALQSLRKAKFIYVFPNKKPSPKGETPVKVTFSRKYFPCMKSLLDEISRLNKTNSTSVTSVTCLYKWPCRDQVFDITEIEEDEETNTFVWSSGKKLDPDLNYGVIKFGDRNSRCSDKPSRGQQLTIHVISNIDRKSKQSLLIDPYGKQSFEEILKSIEGMVRVNPPCMALVTKSSPYVKVQSISTLKSVIPKYGDTFYACGREGDVREKLDGTPNESPTRNGQRRMKNGVKQNVHQQRDDRIRQDNGHMRQSDSQYDQYEDYDEQMENYKPQQRRTSPQRSQNKRNKNQNANIQSQDRQSRRYEDENDDSEERNDSAQQILGRQRRDSPTSPHREEEQQQQSDDDGMDEDEQRDHPSEEEMRKAIDAMDTRNTKLDDDIRY